jgi:hypothetical protein
VIGAQRLKAIAGEQSDRNYCRQTSKDNALPEEQIHATAPVLDFE